MTTVLFLAITCFFTACAPKSVDSCQFSVNIYGQTVKHNYLPVNIVIDPAFPSDFYEDLVDSVKEINRDREYIKILSLDTSKKLNYINELYLQSSWPDDKKNMQGVTSRWNTASGNIQEADIQINIEDYEYRNSGYDFKTLITHELLHALGMMHQTDDPNGVLYPYLAAYQTRGMTEREYKNLECAYGK